MPFMTFHLVDEQYADHRIEDLLTDAARAYCEVLDSPMDRVRGFVRLYRPHLSLVAGELVGRGAPAAPFFEFTVMAGRPIEQRHALIATFTDLIVEHLGASKELIRGRAIVVEPEDWGIAGVPASVRRSSEILARKTAAQ